MSSSVKLGGERLGSGKKNKYITKTFERSTHNLSYLWRSSMSAGTLVPFMSEVGLPGDTFDISLDCDVKTLPTIGPLFGSYKVQLDVFEVPVRLFQGKLHLNKLELGREMDKVHLPQLKLTHAYKAQDIYDDNSQINPSCIFSYLGIRGLGRTKNEANGIINREFNAVPYLGYWSIFKNYYANKQEENAYVIHTKNGNTDITTTGQYIRNQSGTNHSIWSNDIQYPAGDIKEIWFRYNPETATGEIDFYKARVKYKSGSAPIAIQKVSDLFESYKYEWVDGEYYLICYDFKGLDPEDLENTTTWRKYNTAQPSTVPYANDTTELEEFPLVNSDEMTMNG